MISLLLLSLSLGCTKANTDQAMDTGKKPTEQPVPRTTPDYTPPRPLSELVNVPDDQEGLVLALEDKETAPAAIQKLVSMGASAVPSLRDVALHGEDTATRGWAITGLQQIPGPEADTALLGIQEYGAAPELVRTWATAARINRCAELDCVMALAPMARQYPALGRPIRLQIEAHGDQLGDLGAALLAISSNPDLAAPLSPVVLAGGPGPLMDVMFSHPDNNVRRLAAGYLGTLGQNASTQMELAGGYAYTLGAEKVLWDGGALYVPGLTWNKKEAQVLAGHLVSWHLFCDLQGLVSEKQQIYNNLQSINLHRAAGWPDWPSQDTNGLLVQYGQAAGRPALEKVLAEHGVKDDAKYQSLLDQVGRR